MKGYLKMKKIKILHVIAGMDRCGAETFLMNVFRNINRNKFEFYFLCYGEKKYDYEEEIEKLGGYIIRIPSLKQSGLIEYIKNLNQLIKEKKFDVIHTHTYFNSAIPLLIARKRKLKLRIVHSHSTMSEYTSSLIKKIYNYISKYIIDKNANVFLACSDEAGKSLFYEKRKFKVIKNGIDLKKFLFDAEKRKDLRKELNIQNNDIVIGHIGRFEEEKNHEFLIDVFKNILKKDENYKLVLVGNGSRFEEIKKKCQPYKENIIFLGNIGNVSEIINTFDFFVFPSLFEGLGIVLIEAQANGLKCFVSTEVPVEANIFNKLKYLKLSEGVNEWSREIMKEIPTRNEVDIRNCEYNISNTVNELEKIYVDTWRD